MIQRKMPLKVLSAGLLCQMLAGCFATIPSRPFPPSSSPVVSFDTQGEQLVGPGDELLIRVMGQPELTGPYKISSSGNLYMPLIGSIRAMDQTPTTLTRDITNSLQAYVKSPSVSVAITQFVSQKIIFVGEWNRPGPIAFEIPTRLLEAVGAAGNLSRFATGRIVLIRVEGTTRNRYATSIRSILDGAEDTDKILLRRGDVVVAE
jgi:protein involved in polysaccharide export with SLBB domain